MRSLYYLALVQRTQGNVDEASTYALEYLRKHHEIAQENIPWHVHDLEERGAHEHVPSTAPATSPIPSTTQGMQTASGEAGVNQDLACERFYYL
jgi:hypothetical protein